jgi:hypothetical protein
MLTIHLLLMILALVCFFCAALDVKPPRVSLLPLGLFFWALAAVLVR